MSSQYHILSVHFSSNIHYNPEDLAQYRYTFLVSSLRDSEITSKRTFLAPSYR